MRPARALRPACLALVTVVLALGPTSDAEAQARRRPLPTPPSSEAAAPTSPPVRLVSSPSDAPPPSDVVWSPAPGVVVALPDSAALAALAVESPAPVAAAGALVGTGRASFYGERFRGRRTASGERFDPDGLTAAHRTLPFGTRLRVTHERTGQSVVVRVNDRGPFHGSRVIDLSKAAARRLGMVRSGTARVRIERL